MNRREILSGMLALTGIVVSSTVLSGTQSANANQAMERFSQQGGNFSWKPQKLDPNEVAQLAHAAYHHQGFG